MVKPIRPDVGDPAPEGQGIQRKAELERIVSDIDYRVGDDDRGYRATVTEGMATNGHDRPPIDQTGYGDDSTVTVVSSYLHVSAAIDQMVIEIAKRFRSCRVVNMHQCQGGPHRRRSIGVGHGQGNEVFTGCLIGMRTGDDSDVLVDYTLSGGPIAPLPDRRVGVQFIWVFEGRDDVHLTSDQNRTRGGDQPFNGGRGVFPAQ